ncbi:MAG TPA: NAD(P)H-dependent oxidoreductase [Candidatus Avipropionibacterium avicola]|uniref:NAD(P)H-dependent oxidoreductase n=1 Tax=Candidatus Avipropionibacterium avicola TaxID=2840701 RepID=A0A9D1KN58_9ACTN|nr:NAD(P)H-dependent oxidoreductase [Candidatus Avipropionibacterium avicola]
MTQHIAPLRVAVLIGSIRTGRFGPTPARWIGDQAAQRDDLEVDVIDLADHDCPPVLHDDAPPASVAALGQRLQRAEAFIVVTPVYNRGYPASVKNAIDWFYGEWQLKPIGFVSYGGRTGGLQSIDALRGVFTEFHAVTLRDTITFANQADHFDDRGHPVDVELTTRLAASFLDQLTWWGLALREARHRRRYPFAKAA